MHLATCLLLSEGALGTHARSWAARVTKNWRQTVDKCPPGHRRRRSPGRSWRQQRHQARAKRRGGRQPEGEEETQAPKPGLDLGPVELQNPEGPRKKQKRFPLAHTDKREHAQLTHELENATSGARRDWMFSSLLSRRRLKHYEVRELRAESAGRKRKPQ